MDRHETSNRWKVGLFLACGLVAVGAMVVYFGRFGEGIRKSYSIRVEYPNASGLLQGSSVLLAGAKIGTVETAPQILPDMQGVFVMLRIHEEVKIPSKSVFTVGSSGLLGDRFVQILTTKEALSSPPIEPGAVVRGQGESGGFGELADGAGALMSDVRAAVANINMVAEKLDKQVLNDEAVQEVRSTLANLQTASAEFSKASGRLDGIMDKAETAMASGEATLAAAKAAADEFRKTAADTRGLISDARRGRGLLGALLSDKEMADNIRALAANLRQHGILWYRDRAVDRAAPQR